MTSSLSPVSGRRIIVHILLTVCMIGRYRCSAWVVTVPPSKITGRSTSALIDVAPPPTAMGSSIKSSSISSIKSSLIQRHSGASSTTDTSTNTNANTSSIEAAATPQLPPPEAVDALTSLAQTTLALLSGDETSARTLSGSAAQKRELVRTTFATYDTCGSGTLSVDEARTLFVDLARSIVTEIASSNSNSTANSNSNSTANSNSNSTTTGAIRAADADRNLGEVARSHARRVLTADENGTRTIERVATKLLLLADIDGDGKVSLPELAGLFDTVFEAQSGTIQTFPQPLRALAGSLQLLPPTETTQVALAANRAIHWHTGVPGDDHSLRRVELERGLSIVGLGRSADASTYFLPELNIVFDAGIHVTSLRPRTVLLTHGHRDHIGALPVHAQRGAKILAPGGIAGLVRRFLMAEAQLNYGDGGQTDEETVEALGEFDIVPVGDGDEILLPRGCYTGSPTPLGVEVFTAPHKDGVPAVSYGLYRVKNRLKEEYASLPKSELGALIQKDVQITEAYDQGLIFYTGDTTIDLLRDRYEEILPKYRHIIHEVTFLGQPSSELDDDAKRKGHTHYSQLHPWICAFPETTFVCVHWSLRYSREDVLEFFDRQYGGVPKNVVLWI